MQIILSLCFLFSSSLMAACQFKNHVSKVYSLSGPVTIALKEMGLLKDSKIKGISVFNPIGPEDFKGERLPGGVFLARTSFEKFSGGVVFYDESRELSKILDPMSSIQGVEVVTRGMIPGEVSRSVVKLLETTFVQGCEKEFSAFIKKTQELEQKILTQMPKQNVVYYLGAFYGPNPPELVMVNDGIVKWLIREKKIQTYPSPLGYVNWSKKVMQSMPKDTQHIAVKDSGADMHKSVQKKSEHIEFIYPGALVPGLTQLEAWVYLMEAK